jgi:hypothetical protein
MEYTIALNRTDDPELQGLIALREILRHIELSTSRNTALRVLYYAKEQFEASPSEWAKSLE